VRALANKKFDDDKMRTRHRSEDSNSCGNNTLDDFDFEENWNLASISSSGLQDSSSNKRAFPVVQKRDNYLY